MTQGIRVYPSFAARTATIIGDTLYTMNLSGQGTALRTFQVTSTDSLLAGTMVIEADTANTTYKVLPSTPFFIDFRGTQGPTAVELANFTATEGQGVVRLSWQTTQEFNHAGFNLWRGLTEQGPYDQLNKVLITNAGRIYQFVDRNIRVNQTYFYRIVAVDVRGNIQTFGPLKITVRPPLGYTLSQNYPNPFNAVTTIRYELPKSEKVSIVIYNILGQPIRVLVDEIQQAGYHSVVWDGRNGSGRQVASGMYTYRMKADNFAQTRKMILLK